MAEYERYNTRNVAQKEIYDSYMGILRISPNEINGSDIDDPTQILNTLYNEENQERTNIILSDSDGNVLPITFQPRAFETKTVVRQEGTNTYGEEITDLLHVATIVNGGKGYVFASKNFTQRGSMLVELLPENNIRHSVVKILSGGEAANSAGRIVGEGWLLYPSQSPNDSNYFNDKNKHSLFDENNTTIPRYKQVENTLYSWTADKHNTDIDESERVIVAGKYVTQTNQYNEEIPVYYTRDYILGHYDGHQIRVGVDNNMQSAWGINGLSSEGKTDYVTKLSWTRFDKLIWETLNEILTGNVRHHEGRYDSLGLNESADPGIRELLGFDGNTYKEHAPILGTEMPRGIVMYHAMPFHRYWYHRTRQALRGFIERKKSLLSQTTDGQSSKLKQFESSGYDSLDKWIIEKSDGGGLTINDNFETNSNLIHEEIEILEQFYKDGLITPCSIGTVGFVHSLAKNFVLCNGRNVTFANFPNLSLTNEVIFDTYKVDEETNEKIEVAGNIASYDATHGFKINNSYGFTSLGAVAKSSSDDYGNIKLPNLFALFETTPRFIRGLNWRVINDSNNVKFKDEIDYALDATDDGLSMGKNTVPMEIARINGTDYNILPDNQETTDETTPVFRMVKDITTTSLPFLHTYDHLVLKEIHQHNMFSSTFGGGGEEDGGVLYDMLHDYHCQETRGGHESERYCFVWTNLMNFDRTYSKTIPFVTGTSSCYIYVGDSNGWKDLNYIDYNYNTIYKGDKYKAFTPIPNLGYITFNASIFNNKGDADAKTVTEDGKKKTIQGDRGTIDYIENEIHSNDCKLFYTDGEGRVHPLSEGEITPVGGYSYILGNRQRMKMSLDEDYENDNKVLKYHDAEKQRRKFMAKKMNEAEGFIPISMAGRASGKVEFAWSRDERRGSKPASRNTYHDHKYNVASYIMTQYDGWSTYPSEKYWWRCWSSIAYLNANKLGVGDVKNYITNRQNYNEDTDYYDVNCVTDLPQNIKFRNYKYGGERIEADESCPSPAYMNLLPLIRI